METSSCSFVYSNTGGDGPAVVLLHGVLMNGTLWDDVVDVACVVRTAKQVRGVLERNPLREVVSDPSRYLVTFLSQEPDPEMVEALLGEDHSPEVVAIEGAEAYVWTPDGVKAMTLSYAYLEKRFGVVATARNWNTIEKIVAKL